MSAKDEQIGGNHYKTMKIQPVEFIEANGIGFCAGNVIKYVCRYQTKNGAEDLRKARHYIDLLLEQIERDSPRELGEQYGEESWGPTWTHCALCKYEGPSSEHTCIGCIIHICPACGFGSDNATADCANCGTPQI